MHELSIALSIIDGALQESESRGGIPVCAVHIKVGPLSGVDRDALGFAYMVAREGTPLNSSELVIHDAPATLSCANCHTTRSIVRLGVFRCPECGSPAESISGGTELEITGLEIAA